MKNAYIFLFYLVIACKTEDETLYDSTGVATKLHHIWNTSLSDNVKELAPIVIKSTSIYDSGKILCSGFENGQKYLGYLNSDDGKVLWKWNDVLGILPSQTIKDPLDIQPETLFQYNNLIYFNYSTSSYILNLDNGSTVSKYKVPLSRTGRFNVGFENTIYSIGSDYDNKEDERIYISSINPIEREKPFLSPTYTPTKNVRFNGVGRIYSQITFKQDNQEFLAFTIINPISADLPNNTSGVIELNLYNITKKDWVYQKMPVRTSGTSIGGFDLIYKDKQIYFMSSDYVYCHNALTGDEKWANLIGSAPLTSRMTLQNNKLYAACEDRFLYCLDINTGQTLWKEQNTGTCSPISYLNGVLYYLGGGDGKLHAVDANTGKHLWKLNSPDVTKNSGAFFYGVCAAVPGKNGQKGKVIGTTGLNAYCFEAIR